MSIGICLARLIAALPVLIYYLFEGLVKGLVPRRYRFKSVTSDTILITGAGSGIGRELAKRFAQLGARLVLLDIDINGLKKTECILKENLPHVSLFCYQCDVSKNEAVHSLAERILNEAGNVTMLVNNAGIVSGKKLLEIPDQRLQKTMDVNAMAHFWTCKAFLPAMVAANKGHIVTVASLAGYGASGRLTDYCASKFAAVGFSESLRMELARDGLSGIKITVIAPYLVNTGLFEGFKADFHEGLSTDWVADEIIAAILSNQEVAMIPNGFKFIVMLGAILPGPAVRKLYEVAGLSGAMDDFQGRTKKD